ncbi:MAG: hypothetical protein ABI462_04875 [Ignavibacteria bacterium]
MYRIKFRILFLVLSSLVFISCSDNAVNNNDPPSGASDFKYPYKTGAFWYYTTKNFVTNIRPDSIQVYFSTDTIIGNGAAEFSRDSIINNDTLKLLKNSHSTEGHSHTTLEYYKQTDTGLVRIAFYSNGANFGPYRPAPNQLHYSINGRSFHSIQELLNSYNRDNDQRDSTPLIFDDPPLRTIKYPIAQNSEWLLVTYGTTRITKKYLDFETVVVPAGSFNCIKIQRNWYYNSPTPEPNSLSYDYFSKEGMVKRDFLIKNVLISNSLGQQIGSIDVKEEDFLNLYNLP